MDQTTPKHQQYSTQRNPVATAFAIEGIHAPNVILTAQTLSIGRQVKSRKNSGAGVRINFQTVEDYQLASVLEDFRQDYRVLLERTAAGLVAEFGQGLARQDVELLVYADDATDSLHGLAVQAVKYTTVEGYEQFKRSVLCGYEGFLGYARHKACPPYAGGSEPLENAYLFMGFAQAHLNRLKRAR